MLLSREPRMLENLQALGEFLAHRQIASVLLLADPALMEAGLTVPVEQVLVARRIDFTIRPTSPSFAGVSALQADAAACQAKAVIALGGGTTVDCAKALRAACGKGVLLIALPATSGAGSEYLSAAYIEGQAVPDTKAADAVLHDASFLRTLPADDLAHAGMIALTHALSACLAPMGLPSLAKKAEQAVSLMVRSLRQAYQNPEDMDARATLMQASALTGPAFARQRGGYVHALARVLQNAYGLDYAEVCAAVLPDYLLGSGDLKRLAHIARETGIAPIDVDDMSAKESLVNWIISLCEEFQLPQVFEGIERRDLYRLATQAMALCSSSVPPDMLRQQLEQTLEALMAQPERISIDAAEIVERQKAYFAQGDTLSAAFRRDALSRLRRAILAHEEDITRALHQDLGKSASESYMCEIGMTLSELKWMLRHVGRHCRRHYVPTPLAQFSAESFTVRNPYGVALIMAPWNYPFLLTMSPLLGAIAAGNCCVVKPSAYAPATSAVVRDICRECFPQDFVAVVEGGRAENQALMAQEFDKIFFTGSPAVGKEVLRRAAEHYTPVTLELGGKSPVVVDRTANLPLAAKRIAFGKLLNAGQTCIAPDYILIDRRVKDRFIDLLRQQLTAQAGENALVNSDYVRMVNRKHFDRVMGLIDPRKVVAGGQGDPETLRIQPTILDNVTAEDAVMQEEIFGPVLPIIAVEDAEEAIRFINARPHPLACYLFSHDRAVQKRFLSAVPYGGGCINDVIIHLATSRMPFGGVGMSGMGNYHGQKSLDAFSHEKAIVKKHTWIDLPFRYAPYSKAKDRLIRFFLR